MPTTFPGSLYTCWAKCSVVSGIGGNAKAMKRYTAKLTFDAENDLEALQIIGEIVSNEEGLMATIEADGVVVAVDSRCNLHVS